jgi:hypothetical protein
MLVNTDSAYCYIPFIKYNTHALFDISLPAQ